MKSRYQFHRRLSLQPSSSPPPPPPTLREEAISDDIDENEDDEEDDRDRKKHEPVNTSKIIKSGKSGNNSGKKTIREENANPVHHKIVVLGAAKVGKSAIISRFLYGTFATKYKRTVEEMHHGEFNVSGVHLTLDILDTSGAYEFPAMRDLSIKSADAFVLVYDITDSNTFLEVKAIRAQILETKGSVPMVVVGNKVDLAEDSREVETESTKQLVSEWENGFVESSAKENVNVSEIFKELLVQAKVKYTNLSPVVGRRRRQSLPPSAAPGAGSPADSSSVFTSSSFSATPFFWPHLSHRRASVCTRVGESSSGSGGSSSGNNRSGDAGVHILSAEQLEHLQQIRDRSDSKRNSCLLS